jgi:hypothetical protein
VATIVLKLIASVLSAGYGIFATLTDFHETRDGRQTLTRAGKQGIAFLLIVSAFGVGADMWEKVEGQQSSAETAHELKSVLTTASDTTTKLDSVLTEAQRAADPLRGPLNLLVSFGIEQEGPISPYLDRVARDVAHKPTFDLHFKASNAGFPDLRLKREADLADLAGLSHLSLDFYMGHELADPKTSEPYYSLGTTCVDRTNVEAVRHLGIGRVLHSSVLIDCDSRTSGSASKDVRGYRDLDDKRVSMEIDLARNGAEAGREFEGIEFNPTFALVSSEGRVCNLIDLHRIDCQTDTFAPPNRRICFSAKTSCD